MIVYIVAGVLCFGSGFTIGFTLPNPRYYPGWKPYRDKKRSP